ILFSLLKPIRQIPNSLAKSIAKEEQAETATIIGILAKKALEKNVAFVPSCVFDINEEKSTHARFNFTNSSKSQMKAGIKTIAKILNKD
ncbi:MAG: hypothetical protein ACPGUI_05890, partial [Halarcobacter sp.]